MTFEELMEMSAQYDAGKGDTKVMPKDCGFKEGRFGIKTPMGTAVYQVEDWALTQMAQKLDIPIKYLRKCPPTLQSTNLNHWLGALVGTRNDKEILVRTHNDRVRAFLSNIYTTFPNTRILEFLDAAVDTDYQLARPVITRDDTFIRVVIRDKQGPGGNWGHGIYVHNGETGRTGLTIAPFIMRTSCTNSTIWDRQAWKVRHAYYGVRELQATFNIELNKALGASFEMVEMVAQAEMDRIPKFSEVLNKLAEKHKFNDDQKNLFILGTEKQETRMGIVNGLTFMSQHQKDPNEVYNIEALAGAILAGEQSLFGRAARQVNEEQLEPTANGHHFVR